MPKAKNLSAESDHQQVTKKNSKDNYAKLPPIQIGPDTNYKNVSPKLKKKLIASGNNTNENNPPKPIPKTTIINKSKPNKDAVDQQRKEKAIRIRKNKDSEDNKTADELIEARKNHYDNPSHAKDFHYYLDKKYHHAKPKLPFPDIPPSTTEHGNTHNIDYLGVDLVSRTKERVDDALTHGTLLADYLTRFSAETEEMIKPARDLKAELAEKKANDKKNPEISITSVDGKKIKVVKQKKPEKKALSASELKKLTANAGVIVINETDEGGERSFVGDKSFTNLPASLSPDNLFPGLKLLDIPDTILTRYYSSDNEISAAIEKSQSERAIHRGRIFRPASPLPHYLVEDIEVFLKAVALAYSGSKDKIALHGEMRKRIRDHVIKENYISNSQAGVAGTHAEVQALNYLFTELDNSHKRLITSLKNKEDLTQEEKEEMIKLDRSYAWHLSHAYIVTERLFDSPTVNAGQAFVACANCTGILNGMETIVTGTVSRHKRITRSLSVKYTKSDLDPNL